MMNQLDAMDNPSLATAVINEVLSTADSALQEITEETVELRSPEEHVFDLPAGYVSFDGSSTRLAEVRELTGRDEEAIARTKSTERTLQEILSRGTVRIGDQKPTDVVLDSLLSGDRDYLLLRIFAATFGSTITARPYCPTCQKIHETELDLLTDVKVRTLSSPLERRITVTISKGTAVVDLPNGTTQRKLIMAIDKSVAELSSVLLENTVVEINGMTVISPSQILDLPIRDRRKISEAIIEHNPGPQLQEVTVTCECGRELEVPLSLAALFQFS
jgi:hypothetical protein